MPWYYYYDFSYLYFLIPSLIITLIAQIAVKHAYSKYSGILSRGRISGAEAAREVLRMNGVSGVQIERVAGNLTDHYDPRTNVIRLSSGVYDSSSIAAIGIAAHEAGHAVQYDRSYFPIKIRSVILPITQIGSQLAWPLVLLGLVFETLTVLSLVGVILYGMVVLFQLITLPVEFNASRRAMEAIKAGNLLEAEEAKGARAVLSAAASTYLAAMLTAVLQLFRLMSLVRRRR